MHFFSLFLFVNQPPRSFVAHVYLNVSSNIPIPDIMDSRFQQAPVRSGTSSRGGCWSDGKWSRTTNPPSWGAGRELLKRWNNPMGSMRWNKKVLDLHFCKKMILHLTYEAGFSASQSNLKPQVINLSWVEQCSNPCYMPLNWLLHKDSPI